MILTMVEGMILAMVEAIYTYNGRGYDTYDG